MYQIPMLDVILIDTTHQRLPQGHLCMVAAMVCILKNFCLQFIVHYIFQETSFIIQFVCHHFCFYFSGGAKTLGIFQVFFFFLDAAAADAILYFFLLIYIYNKGWANKLKRLLASAFAI